MLPWLVFTHVPSETGMTMAAQRRNHLVAQASRCEAYCGRAEALSRAGPVTADRIDLIEESAES